MSRKTKNPYKSMVRARGFEPPRECSHWILSPKMSIYGSMWVSGIVPVIPLMNWVFSNWNLLVS